MSKPETGPLSGKDIFLPVCSEGIFQNSASTVPVSQKRLKTTFDQVKDDGALALVSAKSFKSAALVDALDHFCQAKGFFTALLADPEASKLVQEIVDAYNDSGEDAHRRLLEQICAQKGGLKLLLGLKRVRPTLLEGLVELAFSNVDNCLALENCDIQVISDGLGCRVLVDLLGRILEQRQHVAVDEGLINVIKYLSKNHTDTLQGQCFAQLKKTLQSNDENMDEKDIDQKNAAGFLHILQESIKACSKDHDNGELESEYFKLLNLTVLPVCSSVIALRSLAKAFMITLPSDPLWAVRAHKKIINGSSFRQLKLRAVYVTAANERLNDEQSQLKDEAMGEVDRAFVFFKTSLKISLEMKSISASRPLFFEEHVLPLIRAHPSLRFRSAIEQECVSKPSPKTDETVKEGETDETLNGIVQNLDQALSQITIDSLTKMTPDAWQSLVDNITKNIRMFCALASGPDPRLKAGLIRVFTMPTSASGLTADAQERISKVFLLCLQSRPFIGEQIVELLAGHLLTCRQTSKNDGIFATLLKLESNEVMIELFMQMAMCGCRQGNLEHCLKALSIYARFQKRHGANVPQVRCAAMGWLRDRLGKYLLNCKTPEPAIDEYDVYVNHQEFFSSPDEFISAEMECKLFVGIKRSIYIADVFCEYFDPKLAIESSIKTILKSTTQGTTSPPNADVVLALRISMEQTFDLSEAKSVFMRVWAILAEAFAWDQAKLLRLTESAMEISMVLFPQSSSNNGKILACTEQMLSGDLWFQALPQPLLESTSVLITRVFDITVDKTPS